MTRKERERLAALRPEIIRALVVLERKYGEHAVSGAYSRHREARRLRAKLQRQREEFAAKLRKLR